MCKVKHRRTQGLDVNLHGRREFEIDLLRKGLQGASALCPAGDRARANGRPQNILQLQLVLETSVSHRINQSQEEVRAFITKFPWWNWVHLGSLSLLWW